MAEAEGLFIAVGQERFAAMAAQVTERANSTDEKKSAAKTALEK
jgi:hypothetical protein